MAIAAIGLFLYFRALRRSERFVSVTGKGFRPRVIELGRSRWVHGVIGYLIAFVSAILPLLMIIWMSLQSYFVVPDAKSFKTITGAAYSAIFQDSQFVHDFTNNLEIGIGCALATTLLAAIISWIVVRGKWRGSKTLDTVAFLPVGIPGIVLGLAVLWMYLSVQGINNLYGTLFIIAFAFMAAALPTALRITHPGLAQVSDDLEEASRASGAGWFRTFFRITLPVISGSLAAAFIITMTLTFKVLSVPMMLYSGGTETVPVYIYEQYQKGNYSGVAAAGVILAAVLAVLSGLSYLLSRRFGGMARMET
jgi:iron(III) transport system permease protein